MKKPLFNHSKESCILCLEKFDRNKIEFGPDWFSYMCVECMEEHAKRWGIEFENNFLYSFINFILFSVSI